MAAQVVDVRVAKLAVSLGAEWGQDARQNEGCGPMKRIALVGEFMPTFRPHVAMMQAIQHSSSALGVAVAA